MKNRWIILFIVFSLFGSGNVQAQKKKNRFWKALGEFVGNVATSAGSAVIYDQAIKAGMSPEDAKAGVKNLSDVLDLNTNSADIGTSYAKAQSGQVRGTVAGAAMVNTVIEATSHVISDIERENQEKNAQVKSARDAIAEQNSEYLRQQIEIAKKPAITLGRRKPEQYSTYADGMEPASVLSIGNASDGGTLQKENRSLWGSEDSTLTGTRKIAFRGDAIYNLFSSEERAEDDLQRRKRIEKLDEEIGQLEKRINELKAVLKKDKLENTRKITNQVYQIP